jgi:hypothetical protein
LFVGIGLNDFEAFEMSVFSYDIGAIIRHRSAPQKTGATRLSAPVAVLGRAVIDQRTTFSGAQAAYIFRGLGAQSVGA